MAINVTFNGATIYKPGAYSKTNIDLGGGFAVGPAGLIAVLGEADAGAPGAQELNIADNRFGADQLVQIRNKYRSGPIADSAAFLFAPASDAAIPSGAQTVWYYKTNNSTQASLALANSYGTVKALEYGIGGNRMTFTSTLVGETAPTTTGAATDFTAITGGETFTVTVQGDSATTNIFTATAAAITVALMQTDLDNTANWSLGVVPAGMTFTAGGTDAAGTITAELDADATAHQNGYGRSFEISGSAGLGLSDGLVTAAVEPSVTVLLDQKRDDLQESDAVGGNIVMTIGNDGTGGNTAASVTVDADNIILLEDAAPAHTLPKSSYTTVKQLADDITLKTGWTAAVADSAFNQLSPDALDEVTALGAWTVAAEEPARLKSDADDVDFFFTNSSLGAIDDQSATGLPDALAETSLAGGARGVTTPADIITALDKFTKFHVNSIVPLFSRDATADIADGLTDAGSTYTIDGIHQAVKTHISLMKTTKRRSERQGYLSYKSSFVDAKTKAGDLADGRLQLFIQDVRQTNAQGTIQFFQPWVGSCMMAGARGGAPVGEPLTFKFMNASGIRHTAQPMSTAEEDIVVDFDPDLQTDEAIQAGISFMEAPQTGGFRVVVDNTTYGVDDNFVFNRANVLYAADIVAFNLRVQLENRFVGKKNTVSVADVISAAQAALDAFLSAGITVSTPDAPSGYKNLTARIEGNTIFVDVVVKLVEGIDFVLSEITVQRATSA
jgi:hypothetical protein